MAKGHDAADWTVMHAGNDGAIRSGEYRARFCVDSRGVVQIIWQDGPEPKDRRARRDRGAGGDRGGDWAAGLAGSGATRPISVPSDRNPYDRTAGTLSQPER